MSDIKERNNRCLCGREVFENGKCILHCEKDDWYDVKPDGHKIWKSEKNISLFWREFKKFKDDVIFDIKFPEFLQSYDKNNKKYVKYLENKFIHYKDVNGIYNLHFHNCLFYGKTYFPSSIKKITISDSIFMNKFKLKISSPKKTEIRFDGVEFIEDVRIYSSDEFNKFEIHKTTFHKEFNFVGYNKKILVKNTIYNETYFSINPNDKSKPDFKFIETTFNKEMHFAIIDLPVNNLEFVYCTINNRMTLSSKGHWYNESNHFQNSSLDNLRIFHCVLKPYSELYVNIKSIANIKIEEVLYLGKIVIKDLLENNELIIRESNVANINLSNCNLDKSTITILDSLLFSGSNFMISNNTKWPSTDSMNCDRDIFRQLKLVNDMQANYIEANKFYSAEMEAYKKEITAKGSKAPCREKIIFWMNYMVSDFGRSWVQPLLWYLVLGLFFSFLYLGNLLQNIPVLCLITGTIVGFYGLMKFRMKVTKSLLIALVPSFFYYFSEAFVKKEYWDLRFNQLLRFINPFDTIKDINTGSLIWWIVFRLFAVFIIYQFIISLRRQTRR